MLEIAEVKSVPYAPVSHPFVERLIGTIQREYLDRTFFWNAIDLARKLKHFRNYYNIHRVHRSLDRQHAGAKCGRALTRAGQARVLRVAAALSRPV